LAGLGDHALHAGALLRQSQPVQAGAQGTVVDHHASSQS
jgi:hypothetical protein